MVQVAVAASDWDQIYQNAVRVIKNVKEAGPLKR